MPTVIKSPTVVPAVGTPPKTIEEFIGRVNSKTTEISVARMKSPAGWSEPKQTPEFDEYTLVLAGKLHVSFPGGEADVGPGQAVIAYKGESIQYSTPHPGGAEYIAICLPAFNPDTVHRENS